MQPRWLQDAKLNCKMATRSNAGLLYVQEIYRLWPFCSAKGRPRSLWQQTGGSQSLPFHFPGCKHPTSRSLASSDSLASSCNLFPFFFFVFFLFFLSSPSSFFLLLSPSVSLPRPLFGPLLKSQTARRHGSSLAYLLDPEVHYQFFLPTGRSRVSDGGEENCRRSRSGTRRPIQNLYWMPLLSENGALKYRDVFRWIH